MAKRDKDTITLGSGTPYIIEYTSGATLDPTTMCKPENRLGYVKGGAALTYTAESYEEKDDLGYVSKIITTSEEVLLKLGLITWNGDTLQYLADRCKVSTASGKRTIKIGGAGNSHGKEWAICFEHKDAQSGNLWIIIRGKNTAGFTLTFAADSGTTVEPEFKAMPQDTDGTLVTLIEEISTTTTGTT